MKRIFTFILLLFSLSFFQVALNAQTTSATKIMCTPDTLYVGDTLFVKMSLPHGDEMYIQGPDEVQYFISFDGEAGNNLYALYKPEKFKYMTQIKIITNKTKAAPWIYSKTDNEIIFNRTGKYLIRVGDELESEMASYKDCEVYYIHAKRK
ncbi:MAG TPA: hypothetical protein VHP30_10355 [Ignavibacteriales bacterium]|nr:hypothetical protein [Ignavibacteriales bacterium]